MLLSIRTRCVNVCIYEGARVFGLQFIYEQLQDCEIAWIPYFLRCHAKYHTVKHIHKYRTFDRNTQNKLLNIPTPAFLNYQK
jgi:hypothetical protein